MGRHVRRAAAPVERHVGCGVRKCRDAHPHERVARGVPRVDLVHDAVARRVGEVDVRAVRRRVRIREAGDAAGQLDERGEVRERVRTRVARERDARGHRAARAARDGRLERAVLDGELQTEARGVWSHEVHVEDVERVRPHAAGDERVVARLERGVGPEGDDHHSGRRELRRDVEDCRAVPLRQRERRAVRERDRVREVRGGTRGEVRRRARADGERRDAGERAADRVLVPAAADDGDRHCGVLRERGGLRHHGRGAVLRRGAEDDPRDEGAARDARDGHRDRERAFERTDGRAVEFDGTAAGNEVGVERAVPADAHDARRRRRVAVRHAVNQKEHARPRVERRRLERGACVDDRVGVHAERRSRRERFEERGRSVRDDEKRVVAENDRVAHGEVSVKDSRMGALPRKGRLERADLRVSAGERAQKVYLLLLARPVAL